MRTGGDRDAREGYEMVDEETGEIFSEQPLYVFNPENIGEQMCIDDKGIAGIL